MTDPGKDPSGATIDGSTSEHAQGRAIARPQLRVGAILAIALAAGLIAWLVTRGNGGSAGTIATISATGSQTSPSEKVVPISPSGLATLVRALRRPIYWAGRAPGDRYELTQTSDGRIYVRYLPPGSGVGTSRPLLTIGTYPVASAFSVTKAAAGESGSVRVPVAGGVAFYDKSAPTNIYVAFSGSNYQIEVFDPSATQALRVVTSGRIAPATPQSSTPSRAPARLVTQADLGKLASALKHPLYWAGAKPGVRYELSQTDSGQVFIRYLAPGTKAGSASPFLTVATYPVANGYDVTKRLAGSKTAVRVTIPGAGLAFYDKQRPTNFYLAFPGSPVQVEVYDPSPSTVRQLVESGQIVPVR